MKKPVSVLEELSLAFSTELIGYDFYKYAAKVIEDEKGKNVFKHLAAEELEHIDTIATIVDSMKKGGGWLNYDEALKHGLKKREKKGLPIFPKENELIALLKKNPTDQFALTVALGSEEKAVKFYADMLKNATEPVEKVFLTKVLEMEKGHLKLLRWECESLVGTGFWCDIMEYSVEKEID